MFKKIWFKLNLALLFFFCIFSSYIYFFWLLLKDLLSGINSQNQLTSCLFLQWMAQNIVLYLLSFKETLTQNFCIRKLPREYSRNMMKARITWKYCHLVFTPNGRKVMRLRELERLFLISYFLSGLLRRNKGFYCTSLGSFWSTNLASGYSIDVGLCLSTIIYNHHLTQIFEHKRYIISTQPD